MRRTLCAIASVLSILSITSCFVCRAAAAEKNSTNQPVEIASESGSNQHSSARLEAARLNGRAGLAVIFEGTGDLHYYAKQETAPGSHSLKITAQAAGATFGQAVYPKWETFEDTLQSKTVEAYSGNFTVFVPFEDLDKNTTALDVTVTITGLACTSSLCLAPFEKKITATFDTSNIDSAQAISFESAPGANTTTPAKPAVVEGTNFNTAVYFLLAVLAGLSFNIMPCVWPVLPLIVMRLVEQSRQTGSHRIILGAAFCSGIVLFFVTFAAVAAVLRITTGAAFNWADQLRYPAFLIATGIVLVVFALFMFDIFSFALPVSLTGPAGSGGSVFGSVGMGFFAALLSTPCSGAILGAVMVWAQTQPILQASVAIILMGLGMALPYAILAAIPALLAKIPKPGAWMDIFKKSLGFLLLIIAVKLLGSLPKERFVAAMYYTVIIAFCAWIWGGWVTFSTPTAKKWILRILAVLIVIATGYWLLPPAPKLIDWKQYDPAAVQKAQKENRPVLIDFTADWCTNCAVLEKRVYHDKNIAGIIRSRNILPLKADTTGIDSQATIDLKKIYGEPGGVPVNIIIGPDGTITKLRGIFTGKTLTNILQTFPEKP